MREPEVTHFIGLGGMDVKLRGRTQASLAAEKFQQEADATIADLQAANQISGSANTQTDELPPYDEWSVKDLKAEAKVRDLAVAGTKDELVARLAEDDDAAEEEEDED